MRGVVGALVVLATAAVGVPAASAGAYDVVSCGAPGADGVNSSWSWAVGSFPSVHPRRRMTKPPTPSPATVPALTASGAARTPGMRRFAGGRARTSRSRRLPGRASRGSRSGGTGSAAWAGTIRAAATSESGRFGDEARNFGGDVFGGAMPSGRRLLCEPVHDRRAGLLGRLEDRPRRSTPTSFKIGIFCGGDNGPISLLHERRSGRPVRLHRSPGCPGAHRGHRRPGDQRSGAR